MSTVPYSRTELVSVLELHRPRPDSRQDNACRCGTTKLGGKSHSAHVADVYEQVVQSAIRLGLRIGQ